MLLTRRSRCGFVAVLAALLLLGAAGAPESDAYRLGGKKWPVRTITYHVGTPQYADAIKAGVRTWNNSGVNVKFKRTRSKSRARLRIEYGTARSGPSGRAVLGYWRKRWVINKTWQGAAILGDVRCGQRLPGSSARVKCRRELEMPRVWLAKLNSQALSDPLFPYQASYTVVHELGHVLGLQHEDRVCSVMWSGGGRGGRRCAQPAEGLFHCRVLEADDVKGAIRRYGGRMAPLPSPEFCPFPEENPPPAPPEPHPEEPSGDGGTTEPPRGPRGEDTAPTEEP